TAASCANQLVRSARDGRAYIKENGGRWNVRPTWRGLREGLGRRTFARSALLEDALRQCPAGARFPLRISTNKETPVSARCPGDALINNPRHNPQHPCA